jgi:exodeoxyribonuclease VII large subunit
VTTEARSAALRDALAALDRSRAALVDRRERDLAAHRATLRGHDPERTLERGFALLVGADGEPVTSAAALREAKEFDARMADGMVRARVLEQHEEEPHGS